VNYKKHFFRLNGMVKSMSNLNFKEYTDSQCNGMLELIVNLHWDLIREAVDVWSDVGKNNNKFSEEKIKRGLKLVDDLQDLESMVKGVPIK